MKVFPPTLITSYMPLATCHLQRRPLVVFLAQCGPRAYRNLDRSRAITRIVNQVIRAIHVPGLYFRNAGRNRRIPPPRFTRRRKAVFPRQNIGLSQNEVRAESHFFRICDFPSRERGAMGDDRVPSRGPPQVRFGIVLGNIGYLFNSLSSIVDVGLKWGIN